MQGNARYNINQPPPRQEPQKERKPQLKITLTFKETERDLYEEVMRHSSKGGWIKDLIRDKMEN
jgi:hypothetical protein